MGGPMDILEGMEIETIGLKDLRKDLEPTFGRVRDGNTIAVSFYNRTQAVLLPPVVYMRLIKALEDAGVDRSLIETPA